MSSAQSKSNLKAARESIAKKDYEKALELTKKILLFEPGNYNALVFAGVSLLNLSRFAESEQSYREAISGNKTNPLAWQGLVNLFEKQGNLSGLKEASLALANIYSDVNDEEKCFAVIDKYVTFVKSKGSQTQINDALTLLLPDRPYFTLIERRVPSPGETCQAIAASLEKTEQETIDKEIAKRRIRLGANLEQVTKDVKREVLSKSELEDVYQKVIAWSEDVDIRRAYESKLLRHAWETLLVCAMEEKDMRREKVWQVAHGMVVLNLPDELAWTICVDWKDFENIEMNGLMFIQDLIRTIPQTGLAKVLSAYIRSELSGFPPEEPTENEDQADDPKRMPTVPQGDILDEMIEGHSLNPGCITTGRILASYLLYNKDYEAASETSRRSIEALRKLRDDAALAISAPETALLITLATSLIHYQAPKHHPQARKLFDAILVRKPDSIEALVGNGRVALDVGQLEEAVMFTTKALGLNPFHIQAKMEHAWALVLLNDIENGKRKLEETLPLIDGRDPHSRDTIAEIWWRIGKCYWDQDTDTSKTEAYTAFVTCLKYNQNYAPAYTSLGFFYADVVNDLNRAYKCFQKAFEMDAGEAEAAEQLARNFADTRQWELVEVVAQRVLQSSRKRLSTRRELSWPHRALGVAELNKRNYTKAIQSFQSALRSSSNDVHAWIGLGEAYANSGRHSAALKSFARAEALNPENWYAKYILGNVQKDVLEFDLARQTFREILVDNPDEFSVSLSLAQTLLMWAYACFRTGEFSRSVDIALEGIVVAKGLVQEQEELSEAWKLIGDASYLASLVQVEGSQRLAEIAANLLDLSNDEEGPVDDEETGGSKRKLLHCNIAAMEKVVALTEGDRLAHSAAYFNLGLAKYRLATLEIDLTTPSSVRPILECFKKAIQSEPRNFEYWNALGVVTASSLPAVAEKAFSRSLQINERNATAWTNLGIMYLIHEDDELAAQAFSRSQANDPENAVAWLGQAILAIKANDVIETHELYQHAFEIGERSFTAASYRFAETAFDQASTGSTLNLSFPSAPLYALRTYLILKPDDIYALHMLSLLMERDQQLEAALETLQRLSDILEREYEKVEDPDILHKFCIVKSDLGRISLSLGDFEGAVENSSTALDLSQGLEGLEKQSLSSQIVVGMGYYFLGQMDEAIDAFQTVLSESNEDVDVMLLVGRALWAVGGDRERDVAVQQIHDCLAKDPKHVDALCSLGAIGILQGDKETVQMVESRLRNTDITSKQSKYVRHLLTELSRSQGKDIRDVSRAGIMLNPSAAQNWINLSRDSGDAPRLFALKLAQQDRTMSAEEISIIYEESGSIGHVQSAVLLTPWRKEGWQKLKSVV